LSAKPENPTFFVGVMHVNRDPWLSIVREGQIPSWSSEKYKNFEVTYFHGISSRISVRIDSLIENLRWNQGRNASYFISYVLMVVLAPWRNSLPKAYSSDESQSGITERSLLIKIPEMTSTMRWKKLAFLNHYLKNSRAEFVIITNSSSILNFQPIADFVNLNCDEKLPFYAGHIHHGYDGLFVSGSFTLINRRAAELLVKERSKIPVHVMDDIAFGTGFEKLGVVPINFKSVIIDSEKKLDDYSKKELIESGHFRLKSGSLASRNDVSIAKKLLERMRS